MFRDMAMFPNAEVRLFNPFCCGRDAIASKYLASLSDFGRLNHRMHNKSSSPTARWTSWVGATSRTNTSPAARPTTSSTWHRIGRPTVPIGVEDAGKSTERSTDDEDVRFHPWGSPPKAVRRHRLLVEPQPSQRDVDSVLAHAAPAALQRWKRVDPVAREGPETLQHLHRLRRQGTMCGLPFCLP